MRAGHWLDRPAGGCRVLLRSTMSEESRTTSSSWSRQVLGSASGRSRRRGQGLITVNLGVYLAQLGRWKSSSPTSIRRAPDCTRCWVSTPAPPPARCRRCHTEPSRRPSRGWSCRPRSGAAPRGWPEDGGARQDASRRRLRPSTGAGISHSLGLSPNDVGLCVTIPEPPAIESTYHFLRALYMPPAKVAKERPGRESWSAR